jgi:hypothetical protein
LKLQRIENQIKKTADEKLKNVTNHGVDNNKPNINKSKYWQPFEQKPQMEQPLKFACLCYFHLYSVWLYCPDMDTQSRFNTSG